MGIGLFGRDDQQDERMDNLEGHIRALTELVQQNQLDMAALRIDLMGLQAHVNEKLSASDFDPTIMELNEELAEARGRYEEVSDAATDSWTTLQAGATDAYNSLRSSLESAAARILETAQKQS